MRTTRLTVLLFLLIFAGKSTLFGQDRCATSEVQKLQNRPQEADQRFEQWLKSRARVTAQDTEDSKRTKAAYQIPVVVHIIHNGEGHSTNISDEQVLSQIRVLNEDFNRENADATQTPAVFQDAAGSLDVEFVLAKRTPEGLPTTGINRVLGTKTKWKISDNYQFKALSYWPAEDYLNIWVCNLEGYLGYAQFPQSTEVGGLENSSTNRLTDGVVIVYDAFGSADDGDFVLDEKYNKGRTATHEIGHYLGLRHISGDDEGDCGNDGDYVSDTPDQASQTYNCPSHPQLSCTLTSMFQNYLDYTNDQCMNLFTKGQASRMKIILDNSPRRKSLNLSLGATDPAPVANDLGIKAILNPDAGECADEITPSLELRNYGSNVITSAQIQIQIDGATIETISVNLSLQPFESQFVSFAPVVMNGGSSTYSFQILQTNGTADGNSLNDRLQRSVLVPGTIQTPILENFNEFPEQWISENPDGLFAWEVANVPIGATANKSLRMNFYDYEDSEGEIDLLITPLIDLKEVPVALMLFDVAHARYRNSNDGLKVVVLSECNTDINEGTVVYEKSGSILATGADSNSPFVPSSSGQWRTESIDLSAYIGQDVQLAFVGVNDWGNNLYLDNVRLLSSSFVNLTLAKVISPPAVSCASTVQPKLLVRNSGTTISFFDVNYEVNGVMNTVRLDADLAAGAEAEFTLPAINLINGENDLVFTLEAPDGIDDIDPVDNTIALAVALAELSQSIPFHENFDVGFNDRWTTISPNYGINWEASTASESGSIVHDGFSNSVVGSEAWLVSPVMDLSGVEKASLYFDVSYALRNLTSDQLEVRALVGCISPSEVSLASYSDSDLSEISRIVPWVPESDADWKSKQINLQSLIGQVEVRIAFVVTNHQGNNLYLDNVELFLSDASARVEVEGLFNVYPNPLRESGNASIAFSFPELQRSEIQIIDNLGKVIYSASYENVLNQVYDLPVHNSRNGLYHVRVLSNGKIYTSKLTIAR